VDLVVADLVQITMVLEQQEQLTLDQVEVVVVQMFVLAVMVVQV